MSSDICMRTLCVKNLPQPTEKAVSSLFGPYGGVFRKIITSTDTNRKDILVEFESEEQATKARNAMHGKMVDGSNLYVDYALFPQASISSPSSNKPQKQKISVLDRIIKPGNPKYPKYDEKTPNPEGQSNGKEDSLSESKNGRSTSQTKKTFERKLDIVTQSPQHSIVKRNEATEKTSGANGSYDTKDKQHDNGQTKRTYTTQKQEKSNQRFYNDGPKKLEIIRPRQDEAKLSSNAVDFPKAINSMMRDKPELAKKVYDFVQNKAGNSSNEAPSKTLDRNEHYISSKHRTVSRSRSRTSKSRHLASSSRSKYNNHGSPRRSRSRSSHRGHRSPRRGHSRSRSYDRERPPYSRERSYSNHRDPYYDRKSPPQYKDSYYYKKSRSRSPQRKEYSPYRDQQMRRDDLRYDYRERSRSTGINHDRSRSRSRSRSSYYRCNNPDTSSKGKSGTNLYYQSYSKSDKNRNYNKSPYYSNTGLVIEKKDGTRMYDDSNNRDFVRHRPKDYSRSRSRDRLNSRDRRSISRERPSQNEWKNSSDHSGYNVRKYSKSPDRSRTKKVLDMRMDNKVEKGQNMSNSNYPYSNDTQRNTNRDKQMDNNMGINPNQQENSNLGGQMQYPSTHDLQAEVNNANQIYANYSGHANLQNFYFPELVNLANTLTPYQTQNQDFSLPTYMYPPSAPLVNLDSKNTFLASQITQMQTTNQQLKLDNNGNHHIEAGNTQTIHKHPGSMESVREKELVQKGGSEAVDSSTLESSTTENSNDLGKPDEKAITEENAIPEQKEELNQKEIPSIEIPSESFVRAQMSLEGEGTQNFSLEFIKKNNKMQSIINYLIATGDIQGLKEKIKSLEKSK